MFQASIRQSVLDSIIESGLKHITQITTRDMFQSSGVIDVNGVIRSCERFRLNFTSYGVNWEIEVLLTERPGEVEILHTNKLYTNSTAIMVLFWFLTW